ncbi:hypothetical protein ABPG72_004769 [Tetrahymena utriculariae]
MISQILASLSLFLLIFTLTESKTVTQSIRLSQLRRNDNLMYVTKFAADEGRSVFKARAIFESPVSGHNETISAIEVGFAAIVDDQWKEDRNEVSCSNIRSKSSISNKFYMSPRASEYYTFEGALTSRRRRHVWFFVIHDCSNQLSNLYANKILLELEIYNVDKSHYPTDEGNFVLYYFILSGIFTYVFIRNLKTLQERYKRNDEMDWPLCLLEISVGLWALGNFFNFLHWLIYGYNGYGFFLFDLLSQIFSNLTSFIVTIMLILLSWGWTINSLNDDFYDILIPLAIILGVIQAMVVGLSKLTDDSFTKYHQYDGWAGYCVLIIRLGLCVYFVFGIKNTLRAAKEKVKEFIQQLGFFGILYFLAFPILLFISLFIAKYVQHKVIKNGIIILESIAILFLMFIFTSKKTQYYNISKQGSTLLPNYKSF